MALLTCASVKQTGLILAMVLTTGCTSVHTRAPGTAVELPSPAPEAVVLPQPTYPDPPPPTAAIEKPLAETRAPAVEKTKENVAAPAPASPPAGIATPPKPVPAPAAAPLDLDALRARLKETAAIGLMAKLELRSQVDALVERFRVHHAGGQPSALDALRQSFNALVQKVLALIREGDPALAATLAGSREAIWGVLEDPVKFNAAK